MPWMYLFPFDLFISIDAIWHKIFKTALQIYGFDPSMHKINIYNEWFK